MSEELAAPPVLSTPVDSLFQAPTVPAPSSHYDRSDGELRKVYEIERTANELGAGRWKRIGLQFSDTMLPDSIWVVEALKKELASLHTEAANVNGSNNPDPLTVPRLYVLADTSYSACCVDEIAAEHAGADVVVHYGRACLSPTARLPVIYVFTQNKLDLSFAVDAFVGEISEKKDSMAIVVADVTYQDQVSRLHDALRSEGYAHILETRIAHNPKGKLPNRIIVDASQDGETDVSASLDLKKYAVFHIGAPPTALLLALSSRVKSLHILRTPTDPADSDDFTSPMSMAQAMLRRRFARVLTVASGGIIGILINTLSVANFLPSIDRIRKRISDAGKKSYTVVVGKLNPAKLANFAEVDGWVVVGCWESGLVEGDGFYRPVITPFELQVALGEGMELWGLEWWAGFEGVEDWKEHIGPEKSANSREDHYDEDGDEDEPPEFDLRTGKLVSKSRPMMRLAPRMSSTEKELETASADPAPTQHVLASRKKCDVAVVKGVMSPGAEFLRTKRTWTGLGSDFDEELSTVVGEGRNGIARGYTVGQEGDKR